MQILRELHFDHVSMTSGVVIRSLRAALVTAVGIFCWHGSMAFLCFKWKPQ